MWSYYWSGFSWCGLFSGENVLQPEWFQMVWSFNRWKCDLTTAVVSNGVVFHQTKMSIIQQEWFQTVWSFIRQNVVLNKSGFSRCGLSSGLPLCSDTVARCFLFLFCWHNALSQCLSCQQEHCSPAICPKHSHPPPHPDIERPPCALPCCQTKTRSIIQACRGGTFSAGVPG